MSGVPTGNHGYRAQPHAAVVFKIAARSANARYNFVATFGHILRPPGPNLDHILLFQLWFCGFQVPLTAQGEIEVVKIGHLLAAAAAAAALSDLAKNDPPRPTK